MTDSILVPRELLEAWTNYREGNRTAGELSFWASQVLAQPASEPKPVDAGPFFVGNAYRTQSGRVVRIAEVANAGKPYETVIDGGGCNRYTQADYGIGRVTGTAHDFSHPENIAGFTHPAPVDFSDAYRGARDELLEWKRRALEAEAKVRTYDQRIVDLGVLGMRAAVSKAHPAPAGVDGGSDD